MMSENNTSDSYSGNDTSDSYEVGYGKPPKSTQFKKGFSGNPKGRPRMPLNFDAAVLRESMSLVTINENGRKIRVSKHDVAIKQLMNNAMQGKPSGLRMYVAIAPPAFEKAAQMEAARARELERGIDVKNMTLAELERLLSIQLMEREREKARSSNKD